MKLVPKHKQSPRAAPRGGVSASMIILEPDELQHVIVVIAAQALDNDEYYATLDSGTNAIIVTFASKDGRGSCGVSGPKCHCHWSHSSSL